MVPDGLSLSTPHPAGGELIQLSATISNTGDLALSGVSVAFYDGDPAGGGTLLGTSSLAYPLAAGITTTLTLDYVVPSSGGIRTLYALVDPENRTAEVDEGDNQASLRAFGPNLALIAAAASPLSGKQIELVSVVSNQGTSASPAAELRYTRESISGTLLISETIPALIAGEVYTATTIWESMVDPFVKTLKRAVFRLGASSHPLKGLTPLVVPDSAFRRWRQAPPCRGVVAPVKGSSRTAAP
jgi:subtilase family serine protease